VVPLDGRKSHQKALKILIPGRSSDELDFPTSFLKPLKTYAKASQIFQKCSLALKEQKPYALNSQFLLKLPDLPLSFK